jgi:branched-chain amino acid transport system substrate-binding protein
MHVRHIWGMAACGLLVLAACNESEPAATQPPASEPTATTGQPATTDTATTDTATTGTDATETTSGGDGSIVSAFAGQDWFAGVVPESATAADPSREPIVVGMINQENSPVGSFPEMRAAVEAAFEWINTELGGVNGRPLRLEACITSFSVEQSQACAQRLVQAGAIAVMSGIDITANGSLPVLEQNGVPLVGGVPATLTEMRSSNAFFFSGGIAGAYVAFAAHAHDEGRSKLAIAYGEFESFQVPAEQYGAAVARSLGLEVELLPFPITTTDYLPVLTAAVQSGADAITVGAADTACVPIMTILEDLGFEGQLYLTGACAAEEILDQVPDDVQAKVIFNTEGPVESTNEGQMYQEAVDRFADEEAGGAGTVTFRAALNLWQVLRSLPEDATPADVKSAFQASSAAPSFWGHPYTCDGNQVPGLPALCAPQQGLMRIPVDGSDPEPAVADWIDVPALVADLG